MTKTTRAQLVQSIANAEQALKKDWTQLNLKILEANRIALKAFDKIQAEKSKQSLFK